MSSSELQIRPDGALRAVGTVRNFLPKELIYREGDRARHFLQVVEGVVRSISLLENGRRYVDAFHVPGDVFGMDVGPHYARSAEAVCACAVVLYPSNDLALPALLEGGLAGQLITALLQELRQAKDHARLMALASAVQKTAAFLVEWSSRTGGSPVVTLAMPRQDLADHLGLTVDVLCRCLAQLNRDRLIEALSVRRFKLLDIPALRLMTA
jgi:CRP/FNR family nitrogen fixation transcriptional regulator